MRVERSDVPPRAAAWTLAGVLGLVALALGIVAGFLALNGGLREARPRPPAPRPGPMLEVSERFDRAAIEARARARLQHDARIEQAMRGAAASGWDAQP